MFAGLSEQTRAIVIGVCGAVGAFFVFGGARLGGPGGGSGDPFDAVPRDAYLVAQLDVAEARRSPLYEVVFGKDPLRGSPVFDAKALGMAKLAEACGFDPLTRVERLAVAVPEEGEKGELGMAARVDVSRSELSSCTAALAAGHGTSVETKEVGSFYVVEQPTGAPAQPRIAYGHGGLLVVGRGAWFDAMLGAADRKQPGIREAQAHTAMRASLTGHDGWRMPTLLVTALLPKSIRDRIKAEMGAEVGAADTSQSIMAGVLGVGTFGLALKAGAHGGSTEAAVELLCERGEPEEKTGDAGCAAVEKLILRKRLELSKELMLRMVGLGPLLDSIDVKREGMRIRVTASVASDTLAATLERVLRLREGRGPGQAGPRPNLAPRRAVETIPAPRASSSGP